MLAELFRPTLATPANGVAKVAADPSQPPGQSSTGEYDVLMTVAEWANVRDNPIQRNTMRRAETAVKRHLSKPAPTHRHVSAAVLPDGELIKLDGHTRAHLWSTDRLARPESVVVTVYPVADLNEAESLYRHFDNQSAAEGARDLRDGAYKKYGIVPTNSLLIDGGVTSAFLIIENRQAVDIGNAVQWWREELLALDSLEASPKQMPSELIVAALLTIRTHGARALDFWRLYVSGGGNAVDGQRDGVLTLRSLIEVARAGRGLGGTRSERASIAGRAISCCEAWLNDRRFSVGAKPTDLADYAKKAKKRQPSFVVDR